MQIMEGNLIDTLKSYIDAILAEYEIPYAAELGKAGCYIQNTPRVQCIEKL